MADSEQKMKRQKHDPRIPKTTGLLNLTINVIKEHNGYASNREIENAIKQCLNLSSDVLGILKPNEKDKSEFSNQCDWARTRLHKCGIIHNPKKAHWVVTERYKECDTIDEDAINKYYNMAPAKGANPTAFDAYFSIDHLPFFGIETTATQPQKKAECQTIVPLDLSKDTEKQVENLETRGYEEPTGSQKEESEHSEMQWMLREIGVMLGFQVFIAQNDSNRTYKGERIITGCIKKEDLDKNLYDPSKQYIPLIDVVWLEESGNILSPIMAFEVEHTTQIYTGILRLCDLAFNNPSTVIHMIVVVPDEREESVKKQLLRPVFTHLPKNKKIVYLLESELKDIYNDVTKYRGMGVSPQLILSRTHSVEPQKNVLSKY